MFRPTPGRLVYLLVGLILGLVALFIYSSVAVLPTFLPFGRTSTASQVKAPTEFSGASLSRSTLANQTVAKNAVVFRVNTIEQYADGFSLTYSLLSGQPGEAAPVLQPDRFEVTDDKGLTYHLSIAESSGTVGAGLSTGYLTFTPALNADVRLITVTVPHLVTVAGVAEASPAKILDGPWQVQVTLR